MNGTLVNKRIEQAIFVMPWVNFMNMFLPVARDKIYDSWIDHMDIQTKASDWSIYLVFCWDDTCRYGLLIPICKSYSANWNNPRGFWSCHQPGVRLFQWRFMSQVRFFSQLSWPLRKVQLELFVRIFGADKKIPRNGGEIVHYCCRNSLTLATISWVPCWNLAQNVVFVEIWLFLGDMIC